MDNRLNSLDTILPKALTQTNGGCVMDNPLNSIDTALDQAILTERVVAPRETFYLSSVGQCPRKQVAERAGLAPTNPPDRRARLKMWLGTMYGLAIQEALERVGFLDPAWHERRFTYRSYSGKVDGYAPHLNAIVEIKTSDDDSITRYKEMPEHYKMQGMGYCLASGIPNLLVFQVGKSQGLTRHQLYVVGAKDKELLEIHMGVVERAWEDYQRTGELPEHFHTYAWESRLCPMLDLEERLAAKHQEAG